MVGKFKTSVLISAIKNGIKMKNVFEIVKKFKKNKNKKPCNSNGLLQFWLYQYGENQIPIKKCKQCRSGWFNYR